MLLKSTEITFFMLNLLLIFKSGFANCPTERFLSSESVELTLGLELPQ